MKNILVPIDFSETSYNAAKYAVSLAQSFNASVILMNVVALPVMIDDSVLASVMITQAEIIENNKKLMKNVVEALSKDYPSKIKGFVTEGAPSEIILNFAEDLHTDLIIMGMKGRGKSNSRFGSTTTTMMRISDVPVLVIPGNVVFKPINTITLASDFDGGKSMGNHIFFKELVEKYHSYIQILKVQKNEYAMTSENVSGKMETDLLLSKLTHRFFTIENNDVERGIHEFLASNPSDILVMVAHKHSVLKRIFGTVHTKEMSYQTKIPLLILQDQ